MSDTALTIGADPAAVEVMLARWEAYVRAQDWAALLAATSAAQPPALRLPAALWQSRVLRLQQQGEAANEVLRAAAKEAFSASAAQLAEFAEELAQCAWYEEAAALTQRLQEAGLPQADFLWATLWREREDWSRCEAALQRLAGHGEYWAQLAAIQQAWVWLRQERLSLATSKLQAWADTRQPVLQKLVARLELLRGQHTAAAARLQAVAKAQPHDWEWPPLLAAALTPSLAETEPQRVLDLYAQGLRRQPRQAEALTNRARLLDALGRSDEARADQAAALAIKPWLDAPILYSVQRALHQQDFVLAHRQLTAARKHCDTPRRAAAALDLLRLQPLGAALSPQAKQKNALAAAETALRQFPGSLPLLRSAGAVLQHFRQFDRAAQCYARALELFPDDWATRNNLALLYRDRGDLEEAIATWRQGNLADVDDTVRLNYAHCLLERGDRQAAREIFTAVLENAPQQAAALRGMAEVAYAAGEDDEAWAYAKRAVEVAPGQSLAWRTAAGIAARRQGAAAASSLLEQGLAHAIPALPLRQALFQRWRGSLPVAELQARVAGWCRAEPTEVEHWLMAADAAYDALNFAECERHLQQAQTVDASVGGLALVRFYLGRTRDGAARRVAEQLVRDDPDTMRHWGLLAEVLYRQGRIAEALEAVDQGLKREPRRLSLVRLKVGFLLAREDFSSAIACAQALVATEPLPAHLALLVEALQRAQQSGEAVVVLQTALAAQPGNRRLRLMLSAAQQRNGQPDTALQTLASLYADEPANLEVVRRYIRALAGERRLDDAVQVARRLLTQGENQPDLQAAVAALLTEQGLTAEADLVVAQGVAAHPQHFDLWKQRLAIARRAEDAEAERAAWLALMDRFAPRRWIPGGIVALIRLGLTDALERGLNVWRQQEPGSMAPWWAAVEAAKEMKRYDLALQLLGKIESKRGPQARIYGERAALLQDQWRLSDAIAEVRRAIELEPESVQYREQLFNILVKAGDFDELEEVMARLQLLLGDRRYGQYRNFFFNINCHPTWDAAQVWRFYKDWYERAVLPGLAPHKPWSNSAEPQRRLRIGYISPDFRRHAVAYFSEPLLVEHDREQFEIFAYAHLDGGVRDSYTERFKSYVHHWIETTHLSDDELERRIREDGIDILIDLAGHTANNRLTVMLKRPAPVQASWIWGAGQTTGLPQVDYLLTDAVNIPPAHEPYIAEKVLRMSHAGMPFIPAHDVLEPAPLPCLTNGFVTFGVLARPVRTNRQTIALWARVLHRLPNALLRFDHVPYGEADVQERMIAAFAEHGIGRERLQFLNTRPHWHVYQEIDIQLDPFPAGSATTASEGLYMERLVITLQSRPPMGLMPDGQVKALGLDVVCSASTEDEYVEKAVALASDIPRLAELSDGLRARMRASWLMDYSAYGREAARLYRQMWQQWCADQQARGTKKDMQA